jgi:uncharacterized protein DUF4440
MVVPMAHCEFCGSQRVQRPNSRSPDVHAAREPGVLDDFAAAIWVQAYDAAWLGQNWMALEKCFAADAAMITGSANPVTGREAVVAYIRKMMTGAVVHEYNATDLKGHASGATGVITYRWQLDWTVGGQRRATSGRDILVLRSVRESWQLVWRAQVRSRSIRDHRRARVAQRRSGIPTLAFISRAQVSEYPSAQTDRDDSPRSARLFATCYGNEAGRTIADDTKKQRELG